ncbi:hypothetical protein [Halorientalis litorea]|uniref:hypothetical protein n=1 Tax=Halorientalis litorea TaxID=2931977 RepID=UPI001FF2EC9D|nr:hypothetical protein [Halorientalis litorea]
MSESQNYEEVTVASDGVTVIKTFEADAFPVPAIAFRINSERSEAVTVTLTDDVPEDVAVEDLGFHPEYGSEFWTIDDDEITFEREIEADEQYTTVYGIRATGTDNVEQFLTEPTIESVDPPLDDDDDVVGTSSDVVRDVISGDTDSVPGLDDDEDGDDDIGTLDLADPNDEGDADEEEADEEDEETAAEDADESEGDADEEEADEEDEGTAAEDADEDADDEAETEAGSETADGPKTATNGSASVESVAATLADEIRAGEVADDDLELLADELDLGGGTNGAVDARIESLQTDVSDLEAYIDALEEFLEDNGTGQDLIEDVQSQLDGIQEQMRSVQSDIDDNNQQVDGLDDTVGTIEDDVQSLKGDIKDLDDDVSDLEGDLGDVDNLGDRLDDLESDLEDLQEWRDQLGNVLGGN